MSKKDKIIIFVFIIFILSLISFVFSIYLKTSTLKHEIIPMSVTFGDRHGFNLTKENVLSLGLIPQGTSAERRMIIENTYFFPIKVSLIPEGDITPFLNYPEFIYLDKKENVSVEIGVFYPYDEGIEKKTYTGNMNVIIKMA